MGLKNFSGQPGIIMGARDPIVTHAGIVWLIRDGPRSQIPPVLAWSPGARCSTHLYCFSESRIAAPGAPCHQSMWSRVRVTNSAN